MKNLQIKRIRKGEVENNAYLAVQFPAYVVFANVVIFIITWKLLKILINDLRGRKKSNKILRRA